MSNPQTVDKNPTLMSGIPSNVSLITITLKWVSDPEVDDKICALQITFYSLELYDNSLTKV
jgi:hypothetical protein